MSKLSPPNPREPWIDARTGQVSNYWLRWLNDIFLRVGGPSSSTNTELGVDMPEDSGLPELAATVFTANDALGQAPILAERDFSFEDEMRQQPQGLPMPYEEFLETQIRDLAEQVAALSKQVEELKQGTVL